MVYSVNLPLPKNYQFQYWLSFNRNRAINSFEKVTETLYSRISFYNSSVYCNIKFNSNYCTLKLFGFTPSDEDKKWLQQQIIHMLDINANYAEVNKTLQVVNGLKDVCNEDLSIPIPRVWGLYEAIIRAIMSQVVTIKAANTSTNRLFSSILQGEVLDNNLKNHFVFSPKHIAMDKLEQLTILGTQKQSAIIALTTLFTENPQLAEEDLSYKDIIKFILPIKGVGMWTCACSALHHIDETNIFVENDYAVNKWLKENNLQIKDIEPKIQPYSSYLANYIWFVLGKR